MSTASRRPSPLLLGAACLVLCLCRGASPAFAGEKVKDDQGNYELRIPDNWVWIDVGAESFVKQSVVAGAERRFGPDELLADGKTKATGQGARLLLTVSDVPPSVDAEYESWLRDLQVMETEVATIDDTTPALAEKKEALIKSCGEIRTKIEKTLETLARQQEIQALLMKRFDADPKKWPPVEVESDNKEIGKIPAAYVHAEGDSANLDGNVQKTEARLFIWIIRKKLYRLAMWAWPATSRDREHLKDDLDQIEVSFDIKNKSALPPKSDKKPVDVPGSEPVKVDGDSDKVIEVKDLAYGFKVTKPKKFKTEPLDRAKNPQQAATFTARSAQATVVVELMIYRNLRAGLVPFKLEDWLTRNFVDFFKGHPEGNVDTYPFAPVSSKASFLSLPDLTRKKEIKRPPADQMDKISMSDVTKAGAVTESRQIAVGKEKVRDAYRFCMRGNAPRQGPDTRIEYTFSTSERTFVVRVFMHEDGWSLWKDEIAEILKSFEILEEPK